MSNNAESITETCYKSTIWAAAIVVCVTLPGISSQMSHFHANNAENDAKLGVLQRLIEKVRADNESNHKTLLERLRNVEKRHGDVGQVQ